MHNRGELIYGVMPENIKLVCCDLNGIANGKYDSSQGTFPYTLDSNISYWKDAKFHLSQTMTSTYSENLWKFPNGRTNSFSSPWSITSPMTTLTLTVDSNGGGSYNCYCFRNFILEDNSIANILYTVDSLFDRYSYVVPVSMESYSYSGNWVRGGYLGSTQFYSGSSTGVERTSLMFSSNSRYDLYHNAPLHCTMYAAGGYHTTYFPMGLYMGGKFIPIYFRNTIKYDSTDITFTVDDIFTYYAPSGSTWQSFISNTNYSKILNGNSEFSVYSSKVRYQPIYRPFLGGDTYGVDANKYIRTSKGGSVVSSTATIIDNGTYYSY